MTLQTTQVKNVIMRSDFFNRISVSKDPLFFTKIFTKILIIFKDLKYPLNMKWVHIVRLLLKYVKPRVVPVHLKDFNEASVFAKVLVLIYEKCKVKDYSLYNFIMGLECFDSSTFRIF